MNEEKLLTVARYLEGDMELQEKQEFEAQLEKDTELQNLVAEYNDVHETLKIKIAPSVADKKVAATLSDLNQKYFKETRQIEPVVENEVKVVSFKSYLKWISVAAVLVLGLFVWAPWSSGLYGKYAISRQMSVAERGDSAGALAKAAELYNAGDYDKARKIMQKEYMSNPQDPLLSYYFSITLIENSQEHEARTVLAKLYEGESAFKYDAAYYIALSYVKQDNKKDALNWLSKIPEGTANYEKAKELSSKL
ncbi:hypothetical protein [Pedobacter sp. B4-66]|uniref:tetratricopeptide repeat protein n=1 Tax=Pedobacter sp. B4-66 TaxID=2817280 RepID=UPI001BD9E7D8|nr:hypothetical protein [Pedobacter sp. B4-66]